MPKKILVVEDEEAIREMLGIRLEEAGYETLFAIDGLSALNQVKENSPDLILLDYTLPKMNGIDVCSQIKENPRLSHIPVILLSAYRREQIDRNHIADDYMPKPYDPDQLLQRISQLVEKSH